MKLLGYYTFCKKSISLIIDFKIYNLKKLSEFYRSYRRYGSLACSETIDISDIYPCFYDDTQTTPIDPHYFYQSVWAFKKIVKQKVKCHVDVGSEIRWAGLLSAVTEVVSIDIRPFKTDLKNLIVKKGSILNLPFDDSTVGSLSCLHVAEHIGLGRYGDKLDPDGTKKACQELSRVLAVNGNLYFSVPVGRQKTYFNAHRVHSPRSIIDYFKGLKLVELSGVTDSGKFVENINIDILEKSDYACGCFWFLKQ